MNIVLTGLRGSGKTKIGELLAKKIKWDFIDLDREIESEENLTIAEIVNLKGWEYFRAKESEIIKKFANTDKKVISTGGGAIIDRDNEKELKKNGKIIYLYRKPEDCCKYIMNSHSRPPLTNLESIEEEMNYIYKQRNGRYCESANIIFNRTDDLEKDVEGLIKNLREGEKSL